MKIALRMISAAVLAALMANVTTGPAAALTNDEAARCGALAKSLPTTHAALKALQDELARVALAAEDAGDAWQEAAAMETWSEEKRADAAAKRSAYDELKAKAEALNASLQAESSQFNSDAGWYNRTCVAE